MTATMRVLGRRVNGPQRARHLTRGAEMTKRSALPMPDRFWEKVEKVPDGCWLWTAGKDECGYGRIQVNGRNRGAHRVSYELTKGPVPVGLEVDHLCRVRACVNPDHLEAVTHRENVLRSPLSMPNNPRRKTHCIHGHTLADAYVRTTGRRACRVCTTAWNAAGRERRRAS